MACLHTLPFMVFLEYGHFVTDIDFIDLGADIILNTFVTKSIIVRR